MADMITQEILQEIGRRIAKLEEETFVMNPPNEDAMYLYSVKYKHKEQGKWRFIYEPVEYATLRQQDVIIHLLPDERTKRLPLPYDELFHPPWLEEWLMNNPLVLATVLYVSSIHTSKSCNEKHQRPIATVISQTIDKFQYYMQHEVTNKLNEFIALGYSQQKLNESYTFTVDDLTWQPIKAAIVDARMLIAEWVYCSFNNNPMEWAAMLVKYEGAIEQCNKQNLIPRVQAGYMGLFNQNKIQPNVLDSIIPVHKPADTERIAKEIAAEKDAKSLQCKPKIPYVKAEPTPVKHETVMDTIVLPKLNIPYLKRS